MKSQTKLIDNGVAIALSAAVFLASPAFPQTATAPRADSRGGTAQKPPMKESRFNQLKKEADQARKDQRNAEACRIYEQLVKLKPGWAEGWWYLGSLYYQQRQFVAASVSLEKFTALEPENGQGWGLRGIAEYYSREYKAALQHLTQARELGLGDNLELARNVRFHQALLLNRSRHFEEAMAILSGFGVEHLESAAVLDALGAAALRVAEPVDQLPAPKQEMVRLFGKATFLAAEQKLDESLKLFEELEIRYRGQPNVAFVFGLALLVEKQYEKAMEYFNLELARDPNHIPSLLRLAFRMLEINQLDSCASYALKIIELEPEDYAGYYLMGRIQLYQREYPQAITSLEKSASLAPELAAIQYALYEAYHRVGRQEDSRKARTRFLELDANEKRQRGEIPSQAEPSVQKSKVTSPSPAPPK
jgi:tetratricopeptide (TPR) repeat protein